MAKSAEERVESKLVRELRKRLLKAENENRRLRKQNRALESLTEQSPFDEEEEQLLEKEEKTYHKPSKRDGFCCPKCKDPCKNFLTLRGIDYFRCENTECGRKGRVE